MSSCVSVATETQFSQVVFTSNSLSISLSASVSTSPPTTLTSTSVVCLTTSPNGSCATSSVTTVIKTNPGATTTVDVPVTATVPIIFTSLNPTRTLFSTSCTATPTTPHPTSSSPASDSPIKSITTSASSLTLTNGSVLTTGVILTSSIPPSSVIVTSTPGVFNNDKAGSSSKHTGAIVGGVVGGVVGLCIIAGIWLLWRKSKRWKAIFDREDEMEQRRMALDTEDVQPLPYHYGLVGHSHSPTPPGSPPLGASERSPGHSPSPSVSLINASPQVHQQSPSLDASSGLISRSGSEVANAPAGHQRPSLSNASSTSGSTVPLLERTVNLTRPPSTWSADAQSIGSGTELFTGRSLQPMPQNTKPHSSRANLPSGAAVAAIPGALSRDPPSMTQPTAMGTRKQREALPPGAAAPARQSSSIPVIPGPKSAAPRVAPPLSPRSPDRPVTLVDFDVPDANAAPIGGQPPAYSPN